MTGNYTALARAGQYTFNATGNSTCYSADEYESGYLHHTKVGTGPSGPLPASTEVFYRVGDPDLDMSSEFKFTTQPDIGIGSLPYRCVAIYCSPSARLCLCPCMRHRPIRCAVQVSLPGRAWLCTLLPIAIHSDQMTHGLVLVTPA